MVLLLIKFLKATLFMIYILCVCVRAEYNNVVCLLQGTFHGSLPEWVYPVYVGVGCIATPYPLIDRTP